MCCDTIVCVYRCIWTNLVCVYIPSYSREFSQGSIFMDGRSLPFRGLAYSCPLCTVQSNLYLIFAVRRSFAITPKIRTLEIFPLYSILIFHTPNAMYPRIAWSGLHLCTPCISCTSVTPPPHLWCLTPIYYMWYMYTTTPHVHLWKSWVHSTCST